MKINKFWPGLILLPVIGVASTTPDPAVVTKAVSLLTHADESLSTASTLEAKYTQVDAYSGSYRDLRQEGTVSLAKPGSLRLEIVRARRVSASDSWKDTGNNTLSVVNQSQQYSVFFHPHSTQVRKQDHPAHPALQEIPALAGFFSGKNTPASVLSEAASQGTLDDVQVDGAEVRYTIGKVERTVDLGTDGLVHRFVVTKLDSGETHSWTLDKVAVGGSLAGSRFRYEPPKDAIPFDRFSKGDGIEIGTNAPDFSVPDAQGKIVRLSELKGRVVLLKFWATWCWPCNQSLPETETLASAYQSQGVETVAVALKDSRAGFDAWVAKHPQYKHIRFAFEDPNHDSLTTLFRVHTTPTVYVIGRDGKVLAEIDGFTGPNPSLENAIKSALK